MEAEREVEDIKAKFHAQYSELAKKLENIQNEKSNEINIIVLEYEERLHKMEERLNATEAESQQIRDRAAADVVLYQKVSKSLCF
jgi:tetrahydromethanopterin S-methyltransferase subunit G